MKLKQIVYGNSVGKIKLILEELKKTGKIKFSKKNYKFKLPDVDYLSISTKDMISTLEIESSNA